jgi:hypothetical protein
MEQLCTVCTDDETFFSPLVILMWLRTVHTLMNIITTGNIIKTYKKILPWWTDTRCGISISLTVRYVLVMLYNWVWFYPLKTLLFRLCDTKIIRRMLIASEIQRILSTG